MRNSWQSGVPAPVPRLRRPDRRAPRGAALWATLVAGVLLVSANEAARAMCNVIPAATKDFRAALGSANRPFAGPGDYVEVRAHPAYWWLIAQRGAFLLGIYGVQAFAQYYLQDVLRVADPPRQTGDLLAVLTLALVALVLAGGWLTEPATRDDIFSNHEDLWNRVARRIGLDILSPSIKRSQIPDDPSMN